jgi:hypothetical protein
MEKNNKKFLRHVSCKRFEYVENYDIVTKIVHFLLF